MELLNKLKSTLLNNQNKHKLIAIGYVSAIALAFILSTTRNNNVIASVSTLDTTRQISEVEDYNEEVTPINSYSDVKLNVLENLKSLITKQEEIEIIENVEKLIIKEIDVAKGDSFITILTNKVGMNYNEATRAVNAYKKVFDPRTLRIGQKIIFSVVQNTEEEKFISLEKISIEPSLGKRFILVKNIESEYIASIQEDELVDEVVATSGSIEGTLSSAMEKANIPSQIAASFTNIFSFTVDFRRDLRTGDKFEIVYENKINQDGKIIKTGDILYASLILRNDKLSLYRFENPKGVVDYFDEKGMALKRTLHRKPLAFQKARISSPFGRRRHPIYKDLRIHWGVDYAAPRGTAVFAAGDGVVQVSKYNGGYGNYVKIRHNSEYSTAYGHMHRFASGIKPGVRVKQGQIIGYVGNTGKSTGPHLHYEVVKNGKRVNPTTIKAATGENLNGQKLESFKKVVAAIKENHLQMFAKSEDKKLASKQSLTDMIDDGSSDEIKIDAKTADKLNLDDEYKQ